MSNGLEENASAAVATVNQSLIFPFARGAVKRFIQGRNRYEIEFNKK